MINKGIKAIKDPYGGDVSYLCPIVRSGRIELIAT